MAKALSIILVVFGHAVVGVDHDRPLPTLLDPLLMEPLNWFRMPLFFFVSGLFAAISIRRSRAAFLDRTLFHLIYVFAVWNVVQFAARFAAGGVANHSVALSDLLLFPVQPINVTWFLWALIAFYGISRLTRELPPVLIVAVAAAFAAAPISTGHYALDRVQWFYVYFALGVALSEPARSLGWRPSGPLVGALVTLYVGTAVGVALADLQNVYPVLKILLRALGAVSVALGCLWLAEHGGGRLLLWLAPYGLAIFVMHTIITGGVREILLRLSPGLSPWLLVAGATVAGVAGPILVQTVMERLGMPWLFRRPDWLRRHPASA